MPLDGTPPAGEQWECICGEIVYGQRGEAAWVWSVAAMPAHCLHCHGAQLAQVRPKPIRTLPQQPQSGRGGIAV